MSAVKTPSEVNAESIGELQAKVAQLEGHAKVLGDTLAEVQRIILRSLDREIDRMQVEREAL